jgi:hypothetical protein
MDAIVMEVSSSAIRSQAPSSEASSRNEAHSSGITWAAVIAGAFATAALSFALLAFGMGIGFSAVSPWGNVGASASAIGWTAIGWLVLMQLIASSVGGYLTGRLRTKWVNVHTHEVYFRDTAHGFLAWAVALVITAAFLTSATTAMIGGVAAGAATGIATGPAQSRDALGANGYPVDTLLRTSAPAAAEKENTSTRSEVGLILANGLKEGGLPPTDRAYLAQVVAARSGMSQSDAERRVDDAYAQARQAADTARKAIAHSMYWTFLAQPLLAHVARR